MVRPASTVPSYRHHKPTNQAVVTVRLPNGRSRDIYLGKHNSAASRVEYNRIVRLVLANNGRYPAAAPDLSINELLLAYMRYAERYYRNLDGTPSESLVPLRYTLKGLKAMFGPTPAAEFGPKSLICTPPAKSGR